MSERVRRARPGHPQRLRAGRARAGGARLLRRADRALRRPDRRRSIACARASRTCSSRPWRSAATATSCASACASAAGGCPSATTATARWPTPTPSPSARQITFARRGGEVHADAVRQPERGAADRGHRGAVSGEPEIRRGLVAEAVAAEHPGLRLAWTEVEAAPGADAARAARAAAPHGRPHARRRGDRHARSARSRTPTACSSATSASTPTSCARRSRRWCCGGCPRAACGPQGLIADALTVAVLETGVGVWAFDAAARARRGSRRTAAGSCWPTRTGGWRCSSASRSARAVSRPRAGRAGGDRGARRGRPVRPRGALDAWDILAALSRPLTCALTFVAP